MNEVADEVRAVAGDESERRVGTIRTKASGIFGTTNWADVLVVFNYVIFTTVTKWLS